MMGCVYVATNKINGKQYVGKTIGTMEDRKKGHEIESKKGKGYFYNALRKYGFDAFEWQVLIEMDDPDKLNDIERDYILIYGTKKPDGYNLTDGGEGTAGCRRSEQWKIRQSKAHRGKFHSMEARRKMSRSRKGKSFSLEHRIKLSMARKGEKRGPLSVEHRAKLSIAGKGKKHTEETKTKISRAIQGKKRSAETKAKVGRASKKRWESAEARYKLGLACRKPWSKARRAAYEQQKN